jgi:hypothetical protein
MHSNSGAAINSNQPCIGNKCKNWIDSSVTFDGLPHDKARYSMAYFCGANNDTILKPLVGSVPSEQLIGWDGKPIGTITAGEYFSQMFDDLYAGLSDNAVTAAG